MLTTSANLVAYDQITCDKLEAAQTNLDEQFGGKLKNSYNRCKTLYIYIYIYILV